MKKGVRRRIAAAIGIVILSPLVPFVLLAAFFGLCERGINWAFDGRWLARKLTAASDRVEVWFGVDAETDYREWQERQRLVTEKRRAMTQ